VKLEIKNLFIIWHSNQFTRWNWSWFLLVGKRYLPFWYLALVWWKIA